MWEDYAVLSRWSLNPIITCCIEPACQWRRLGLDSWVRKIPWRRECLENSTDRRAWWRGGTFHGVTEPDNTEWLTHYYIHYPDGPYPISTRQREIRHRKRRWRWRQRSEWSSHKDKLALTKNWKLETFPFRTSRGNMVFMIPIFQ